MTDTTSGSTDAQIVQDVLKIGQDAINSSLEAQGYEGNNYGIAQWVLSVLEAKLTLKYGAHSVIFNDVKALMNDSLLLVKPVLEKSQI